VVAILPIDVIDLGRNPELYADPIGDFDGPIDALLERDAAQKP
jgi:hypothetical protein